jgi:hypothetical protein
MICTNVARPTRQPGFTLIELLVVATPRGPLSLLVLRWACRRPAQRRDGKRHLFQVTSHGAGIEEVLPKGGHS